MINCEALFSINCEALFWKYSVISSQVEANIQISYNKEIRALLGNKEQFCSDPSIHEAAVKLCFCYKEALILEILTDEIMLWTK